MTRMIIPGIGKTPDLSEEGVDRLLDLVGKLDRPAIDLSQRHPEPEPVQYYDHVDLAIPASDFTAAFELANAAEQTRLAQDAAPLPRRTEDRIAAAFGRIEAGTFTQRGFGLANEPTSGNCGAADAYGRCGERFHAHNCASSAETGLGLMYQQNGTYERTAHATVADARGLAWIDRQYGAPMSMVDHMEAASGVRMGDQGLFEDRRGTRRDVIAPARPAVLGDFDDPDAVPSGVPRSTAAGAAALAAQNGITTTADRQAQQDAYLTERNRQLQRYRPARHADYAPPAGPPAPAGAAGADG